MAIFEKSVAGPLLSLFDFDRFPPSVERLPAALTINGTTKYPTLRYKGDAGATWSPYGYGETLTQVGTGTAPSYNQGSPLLGSVDDSIKFNGSGGASPSGRSYKSSETSVGNVAADDFVVELIMRMPTGGTVVVPLHKYDGTGWQIYTTAGAALVGTVNISGAVGATSGAITAGSIFHAVIFFDRSGSCQWYINGVASGSAVSISAKNVSIDCNEPFTISGYTGIANPQYYTMTDELYYAAMWHGTNWLDTCLQTTVTQTRFAQLTGVYPTQARGTALPTTISGRTTPAYIDKRESNGTTKLYYVGAYWPRSSARLNGNSSRVVKGYLSETASTNRVTYSAGTANWIVTAVSYTLSTDTSLTTPDGRTGCVKCLESTGNNRKNIYQAVTRTASNAISVYIYPIGRQWIALETYGAGPNFDSTFFDMTNVVVGTVHANHSNAAITSLGTGWYRVQIAFTSAGATDDYIRITGSTDGSTTTYAGDAAKGFYYWGAQKEDVMCPTSSIPTTTAAVTRTADNVVYVMNDGNLTAGRGQVQCDFVAPSQDASLPGGASVTMLSDGSNNNRIQCGVNTAGDDFFAVNVTSSGVAQAQVIGSVDVFDGSAHTYLATWQTNSVKQFVDGAADGTEDTSCTIPTSITQLNVGSVWTSGYEPNGVITNLTVKK